MKAGKLSELVLNRSVLLKIRNKRKEVLIGAGTGYDAAVMSISGDLAAACAVSSSFNYLPEISIDSDIYLSSVLLNARLTVIHAANSVSAELGRPFAFMPAMILPESFTEAQIKKVMDAFEETAKILGLQIAGGHSEISSYVERPVFSVTVYGNRQQRSVLPEKKSLSGQEIVMTGCTALEATAVTAELYRNKLSERFAPLYIENAAQRIGELSVIEHAEAALQKQAVWMHDLSGTGVFGGLWELGEKLHIGMEVDLRQIPVLQETIEFSEYMGFHPYMVPSGGSMLIAAADGSGMVRELKKLDIPAAVIGRLTEGNDRVLINQGERRFLEQPR